MADSELERLGRLHGIRSEHTDIWGKRHRVSAETVRALLGAMGVDAGGDAAVRDALARLRDERRRGLPPVVVLREGEPPVVPLALPGRAGAGRLRLSLVADESGERRGAEPRVRDLPVLPDPSGEDEARLALELPRAGPGYHELEVALPGDQLATCRVVVAPERCFLPPAVRAGRRLWGPAVQLYAIRSRRGLGIGDLGDLGPLMELATGLGADLVGLSPLHALFPHRPLHASPYSPSSRLFHNVLFIELEAVPELARSAAARQLLGSEAFANELRPAREASLVDYERVARAKLRVLELLHDELRNGLVPGDARARAFEAFRREGGRALRLHATYESIAESLSRPGEPAGGFPSWPEALRDPRSGEVERFAREHEARVGFFEYLQMLMDEQLAAASRRSTELGLGVGLYGDLALGVEAGGAEAWANRHIYATGASVGAPPDDFSAAGQDWGLPPPVPAALAREGYEPLAATLRVAMRHVGAVRIDHVMGLLRLYWIPSGGTPADGAYVSYPFADLLGVLALESQRSGTMVVGEDLGTVPPEVRRALAATDVLSYKLFYFEREEGGAYRRPADHEERALLAVTTHDLPTLSGFWTGRDLEERAALGRLGPPGERERQGREREADRRRILEALEAEGLLPEGTTTDASGLDELSTELLVAIERYLARAPCRLMLVALEDVLGQRDQVNLPGTVDERPNWRIRLPVALEDLADEPRLRAVAEALRAEGRGARQPGGGSTRAPSRAGAPGAEGDSR